MIDFSTLFSDEVLISFFFKAFAIVFSFIYILYAIVLYKQTQVMLRTLVVAGGGIIRLISFIQIVAGVILLALAFAIM